MPEETKEPASETKLAAEPIAPEPAAGAPPEPPPSPADKSAPVEESKIRRFLRRLFRWTVGVAIVFALGVLAALFLFYQPKVRQLSEARAELDQANEKILSLQADIEQLEARVEELSALEEANQSLQQELSAANLRIRILAALADTYAAQYALALGDVDNARAQLSNTPKTLGEIENNVPAAHKERVDKMVQRLDLVLDEIDSDPQAAESDLGVLANNLIQLENDLFAQP